jgi:acyl dehydratase
MPIDVGRLVGAELPETTSKWSHDDVILYHLGLGAGARPTHAAELAYTYERALKVLPTYAVIPALASLGELLRHPAMDIDLAGLLHGEHELEVHGALPTQGACRTAARVTEVFDKRSAALVNLEAVSRDAKAGRPLATNRFTLFIRGEGGFGGRSAAAPSNHAPDRPADAVVESPTLPQQALLYRLSGDKNPLHADPEFARRSGFDQPILHGLCTYGIVYKAVVDTAFAGDFTQVSRYAVRFSGVVFPGETIVTSLWMDQDRVLVSAHSKERGTPVVTNAALWRRTPR